MFKKAILFLAVAAALAAIPTALADPRSFEEISVRAAMTDRVNIEGTRCPLSQKVVDKMELALLSLCLMHGLSAYEAAQRYPAIAAKVFVVYGDDRTFQEILDKYGHAVIPVVAYFVENGSSEFKFRRAIGEAWEALRNGEKVEWHFSDITPEQLGLMAIYEINRRGHEMLAEFEIVDGSAKPKRLTRVLLGAQDLLLGGLKDLEKVLTRDERRPTWKEVGWAALDVTIVAGVVGAVTKVARAGGRAAGVAEKSTVRLAGEDAIEAITTIGNTTVRAAPIAFIYVAITRPDIIASAGGWIAEQVGFPRTTGIFAVYLIGISVLLLVLQPLWKLMKAAAASIRFVLRHV